MRNCVLHAKIFPDEFFQVRKVEVEVLVESLTARNTHDQSSNLVTVQADIRQSSSKVVEKASILSPEHPKMQVDVHAECRVPTTFELLGH